MALHILKLCVGAQSVDDLIAWRNMRLASDGFHFHTTRMFPKRKEELLNGGSIYWVIKGQIQCRQRFLELREVTDENNIPHCSFILEPVIHLVQRRAHRPFQGWRYLNDADVPQDSLLLEDNEMAKELAEFGVL